MPRLGGSEIAIIDELDKVNPMTGELIPYQPDGYLSTNHLWDAKKKQISLQAARNEFVAFQILCRARVRPGRFNRNWSSKGRPAWPSRPSSAAITAWPRVVDRYLTRSYP